MIITPLLVIFMLIVFVLLFLFLKTVDKRKWLTFLISLILTPVVYFYVAYPFINIISNYHHQKYFDSEDWIEKPALRYEMIDNVIENKVLLGKTKEEVQSLLGNFEWLTWNDAKNIEDSNLWNYSLGIEPGAFNTKKDVLEITFNNNIVIKLKTYKEVITFDAED